MEQKWFQYKEDLNRLRLFRLWKDERERERYGKMLRMIKKKKTEKIRKIHWEEALKQVFNSWSKCMLYVAVYKFKKVRKWHLRNSFCSYILHHILRKKKNNPTTTNTHQFCFLIARKGQKALQWQLRWLQLYQSSNNLLCCRKNTTASPSYSKHGDNSQQCREKEGLAEHI